MPKRKSKSVESNVESHFNGNIFVNYATSDLKKAIDFYKDKLGLDLSDFSKNGPKMEEVGLVEFKLPSNGAILTLAQSQAGEEIRSSNNLVIMVTGIDKLRELLVGKEISPSEIVDDPGLLSFFTVKDFDGNGILFMSEPRIK